MNIQRTKQLVEHLKTVGDRFDMKHWAVIDREMETIEQAVQSSCRTVACIAGWAVLLFGSPEWKLPSGHCPCEQCKSRPPDWDGVPVLTIQTSRQDTAFHVEAQRLLGWDYSQCQLFWKLDLSREQAIARIEDMIAYEERKRGHDERV